jgi:uncharacterized membrane protein YhhN
MKPVYAFICGMFVVASLVFIFMPNARMQVSLPYWPMAVLVTLAFAVLWARAKEKPR